MKKPNCNKYKGGKLPPCAEMLGNSNPLIKDGKIIFRNLNRLFYFISATSAANEKANLNLNIQISLPTYIIGFFIDQIEKAKIEYNKDKKIHSNDKINELVHSCIQNPPNVLFDFNTTLTLVYSNNNAILNPLTYGITISKNNFIILLTINRLENNPGLLFLNNSYVSEDIFNFILAEIDIEDKC